MAATSPGHAAPRSTFVTGLAWSFIVLAGFTTFIAALQTVMVFAMMPMEEMHAAMREAEKSQPIPAFVRFTFENFRLLIALFLAMSVGTLVASIGLLQRRNWARLLFILFMVVGAVLNLASAIAPYFMFSMFELPPDAPAEVRDSLPIVAHIIMAFMALIGIAFGLLFAWIAKRLMDADIRREFVAGG